MVVRSTSKLNVARQVGVSPLTGQPQGSVGGTNAQVSAHWSPVNLPQQRTGQGRHQLMQRPKILHHTFSIRAADGDELEPIRVGQNSAMPEPMEVAVVLNLGMNFYRIGLIGEQRGYGLR